MLDVNRLRVFRAVVHAGGVHAAADNLGLSPSAVSQQIGALQREVKLALFEKSGRGIVATPAGLALADGSDEVMQALSHLDELVEDLQGGRARSVSIGTFPSAGQYWVPQVARVLRAEYPDLVLRLDLIDRGERKGAGFDLDVRAANPLDPPETLPGYARVELVVEPYLLVVPEDHRFASQAAVTLADTVKERLIAEGSRDATWAGIIGRSYAAIGATPRYVAYSSDHHAAIALVRSGLGIALLPRLAVGTLPSDLVGLRLTPESAPTRRIFVFVRKATASRSAVARAVELLREIAAHEPAA